MEDLVSNKSADFCDESAKRSEIFAVFKKVLRDLDPNKIHKYYFCQKDIVRKSVHRTWRQ